MADQIDGGTTSYEGVIGKDGGFNSFTDEQLDNWFTYHEASQAQVSAYQTIRGAAKELCKIINYYCPASAEKSDAIRKVREAVMTANAAIACGGK